MKNTSQETQSPRTRRKQGFLQENPQEEVVIKELRENNDQTRGNTRKRNTRKTSP